MRKNTLVLLSVVSLFLTSCDYYNHSLVITNNTKKPFSILYSTTRLPDPHGNNVAYYTSDQAVIDTGANDLVIPGREDAWVERINNSPEKRLYLYVFDIDTLQLYNDGWSMRELVNEHKYAHVFRYSKEELDRIGWNVVVK